MQSVVQLVNRLQGAATLLGDNAGTADSSLPSLWSMLPSIVVIGGQVRNGGRAGETQRVCGEGIVCSLRLCGWRGWTGRPRGRGGAGAERRSAPALARPPFFFGGRGGRAGATRHSSAPPLPRSG